MYHPTCIGCGKKYERQKQLSAHAARCRKRRSLTWGGVLSKLDRKRKSRARDKLRDAKRARLPDLVDKPLEELDIHQENPLHTHAVAGPSNLPAPVDELELEYVDLALHDDAIIAGPSSQTSLPPLPPQVSASPAPSNPPPRAPHPHRMASRKTPSPLPDIPSESRTPMSPSQRKAPPPPPDTSSHEPTPATPAPHSKKAKAVVSESPLKAEESEEELELQVRRLPRKVQNNCAANNATASKAKKIAPKKRKGKK